MKDKFAPGDTVRFKGFELDPHANMRVESINWESTESGRLKETGGRPVLRSISVGFYDSHSNYIVKEVKSTEIVKSTYIPEFYIENAIKMLKQKGKDDVVEKLKQILKEL